MSFWKSLLGICDTEKATAGWTASEGAVHIDLDAVPSLREPGAAVRLEGASLSRRLLIVHGRDGEYRAYENRCTHMGRRIDPDADGSGLRCCSVSHSRFDPDGRPTAGPAGKPLTSFVVRRDGNRLRVNLS